MTAGSSALHRALDIAPHDESIYRHLMRIQAAAGRPTPSTAPTPLLRGRLAVHQLDPNAPARRYSPGSPVTPPTRHASADASPHRRRTIQHPPNSTYTMKPPMD
jgi:hypothetical protein